MTQTDVAFGRCAAHSEIPTLATTPCVLLCPFSHRSRHEKLGCCPCRISRRSEFCLDVRVEKVQAELCLMTYGEGKFTSLPFLVMKDTMCSVADNIGQSGNVFFGRMSSRDSDGYCFAQRLCNCRGGQCSRVVPRLTAIVITIVDVVGG